MSPNNKSHVTTAYIDSDSTRQTSNRDQCSINGIVTTLATTTNTTSSASNSDSITDFYSNQHIFITGGTGFVGKVLIEKLLYEFRDIGNIYVLLRPKNGQLIRNRLKELLDCPVFDRIRANCPEQLKKVHVINGDIAYAGLGINPLDLRTLVDRVSIVFHSAATIRFDEPLK